MATLLSVKLAIFNEKLHTYLKYHNTADAQQIYRLTSPFIQMKTSLKYLYLVTQAPSKME